MDRADDESPDRTSTAAAETPAPRPSQERKDDRGARQPPQAASLEDLMVSGISKKIPAMIGAFTAIIFFSCCFLLT